MMAKKTSKKLPAQTTTPEMPQISSIEEEKFIAILRQAEEGSLMGLSDEHLSEVLSQRRQISEFEHNENMQEHERFKLLQKNALIQLMLILAFAIIVLLLVAIVDKSYLPQALTLVIGFVGGFGVGKAVKEPQAKKE